MKLSDFTQLFPEICQHGHHTLDDYMMGAQEAMEN
jgi:hypothetical protein